MHDVILIVDDNVNFAKFLKRLLTDEGYEVHLSHNAAEAREAIGKVYPDLVLMDVRLPDMNGIDLFKELKAAHPSSQFIIMTAFGTIRSAVESVRLGAIDYLTKPFNEEELLVILAQASRQNQMKDEVTRLRSRTPEFHPSWQQGPPEYNSETMRKVMDLVRSAASGAGTILITGESGVGKTFLARWVHKLSPRAGGPFFDISCTAIAGSLAESELFGHEPGAFTGSKGRKRGLLELAEGGTLFLDEIGDMEPILQAKLLAFLDTHKIMRLGSEKSVSVNARIVAATNRNLQALVQAGQFRQDLYYRLNVLHIHLPPLRDRMSDLDALVKEICSALSPELGLKYPPTVSAEVMAMLRSHNWPGNIRELRNVLERALMVSADKTRIEKVLLGSDPDLPGFAQPEPAPVEPVSLPLSGIDLKQAVNGYTRGLIEKALSQSPTKNEAARILGITRFSLAHYIKTLGIKS